MMSLVSVSEGDCSFLSTANCVNCDWSLWQTRPANMGQIMEALIHSELNHHQGSRRHCGAPLPVSPQHCPLDLAAFVR